MKKLSLLFTLFFIASCIGSETENTSILKKENQQEIPIMEEAAESNEIALKEEEGKTSEQVEVKEENSEKDIEIIHKKEKTIEEIMAIEELEREESDKDEDINWKVLRTFEEVVTSKEYIKYEGQLPELLNYVIVLSPRINLREEPTTESEILGSATQRQKLKVLEIVENKDGDQWYKIQDGDQKLFVHSEIVALREFRFEKAEEKIRALEDFIVTANENNEEVFTVSAYIPDPNNRYLKRGKDKYGNVQDQSAKAYYNKDKVYVPDGTIVAVQEELNGKYRIRKQDGDDPYLDISKGWINTDNKIEEMPRKVIVVDVKNQNFTVYEKILEEWNLISYSYSKTGSKSRLGFKTPKGNFAVLAVKKIMTYNDSRGRYEGYAKNAIRFSGGGYIHGTPFNRKEKGQLEKYRIRRESDLGTYPGTRKCVRNSVEHSEFLFDWIVGTEVKEGNFQGIEERVSVIVM